jgi:hypothetical protein
VAGRGDNDQQHKNIDISLDCDPNEAKFDAIESLFQDLSIATNRAGFE